MLTQFTQTDLLRSIGEYRIAKLLNHFTNDLLQANIQIPNREQQNGQYLDSVAVIFRDSSRLPHPMLETLLTLENAATSENQDRLESSIQRQLDELSLRDCVLDRALELWFAAPEELSQFATPPSQIENQNPARDLLDSKIENDPIPLSSISNGGEGQGEEAFKPSQPQDLPINGQPETKSPSDHGDGTSPPQIENQNSKIENALPLSSAPSGGEGRGEEELNGGPGEEASQVKNDPASVENPPTPVSEVTNGSSHEAAGFGPSQIQNQKSKMTTKSPWPASPP